MESMDVRPRPRAWRPYLVGVEVGRDGSGWGREGAVLELSEEGASGCWCGVGHGL